MTWQRIWSGLVGRLRASAVPEGPADTGWLAIACLAALACVAVPVLWRATRSLVTVVHETGHALVGVACGRRFVGFRVNTDMSGETVTAGRERGLARIATTAAGYPMPALVGAGLVYVGLHGYASLLLLVSWLILAALAVRARSAYTVLTLALLLGAVGALWWAGGDGLNTAVVAGAGVFLVLGGWRGWLAVLRSPDPRQDPGTLAGLTHIPRALWNALFALVMAASSWLLVRLLGAPLGAAAQAVMP
ncbi:M50 family metallopeptidase [Propionibacterium cyclohexanicum]|nr:M50 family metallopeptidase [Propionibacterium cyclohexanicum]